MKRLALAVLIALGCASEPYTGRTVAVDARNFYRDPVDVTIFCKYARVGQVRWLMRMNTESVRVRAPRTCEFRFLIEPSMTGGPYAYVPRFASGRDYEHLGREAAVCITAGSLVTNSGALQGRCIR